MSRVVAFFEKGSSPLTRGKPDLTMEDATALGLIPAHAGKTSSRRDGLCQGRAHPRSRGENDSTRNSRGHCWGSSPLTRGKHVQLGRFLITSGLIPAHAGKTGSMRGYPRRCGAHPRSRGENPLTDSESARATGSSPLTRGKRRAPRPGRESSRLIPAHAGKTDACRADLRRPRAHPRSRGENDRNVNTLANSTGSSPLTRGKHREIEQQRQPVGLIPAHAGKTLSCAGYILRFVAHPRSRGENTS